MPAGRGSLSLSPPWGLSTVCVDAEWNTLVCCWGHLTVQRAGASPRCEGTHASRGVLEVACKCYPHPLARPRPFCMALRQLTVPPPTP